MKQRTKRLLLLGSILILGTAFLSQTAIAPFIFPTPPKKITAFYETNKGNDLPSESVGSVSNGQLKNGKLLPYQGNNFRYFDKGSYMAGRAYVNHKVKLAVLDAFSVLEDERPGRKFFVMETAHKHGGKLWPHRTHQNGLSVDFMMPKLKNGSPHYDLDTMGKSHYFLKFDGDGKYEKDATVTLDFDLIAQHILILEQSARKHGLKIGKVIINTNLKDDLFATKHGSTLMTSGIYLVKSLTPTVNDFHDDHFHVDFVEL